MKTSIPTLEPVPESISELRYANALTEAMGRLGADPRTLFIGQAVGEPGTAMYGTLKNVPMSKRLELPVAEDMQMGMSIGLALAGFVPVTLFPRWNFLLLAANQLVNHLDKLPLMSDYVPHVIIRTSVGSVRPLDPQHQHRDNFTDAFRMMCQTVRVFELFETGDILPAYDYALRHPGAHLIVEHADYLNEK